MLRRRQNERSLGLMRFAAAALLLTLVSVASAAPQGSHRRAEQAPATQKKAPQTKSSSNVGAKFSERTVNKGHRRREGDRVRITGSFNVAGDRTLLVSSKNDESYPVLENLTLERVLRTLAAQPGSRIWRVEGSVTEFQGENFLLLGRAVVVVGAR